jgi:putative molybdopterin biosynthesis protein
MSDDPSDLLRSADVARLLRVHPKQIYRLLARGLPAHRVGAEWRFSRDEVLKWSGVPTAKPSSPTMPRAEHVIAPPPLVGANGDVVIDVLLARIAARGRELVGLVQSDRGQALDRLVARQILLAGFHGDVPPSHAGTLRLARIHLVDREVGLAYRPSSKVRKLGDLARKRIGVRPKTAGIRVALERALAEAKTSLAKLRAETSTYDSHREVVCAVLRDEVDVALTTAAWAERAGLSFLAFGRESYDLLLHAADLGLPPTIGVCEVAQSAEFRASLAKIAGYDARGAGEIRYEP